MRHFLIIATIFFAFSEAYPQNDYPIVDTGQDKFYNDKKEMEQQPNNGGEYFGQDARHKGRQPAYKDNGNGTVTDLVTGLMWQKDLLADKYNYDECKAIADTFSLAGNNDWRLPTIKELYSLIDFRGITAIDEGNYRAYLDTDFFGFRLGGVINPEERPIDSQYATSTVYKGTTMNGNPTMFGVNFADGRIKGYPLHKDFELLLVRGNPDYGRNDFADNNDGTISDNATGLMWDKAGSTVGMNWKDALAWVQEKNGEKYLGHDDWRLPNAKELHSLVDYSRSPQETGTPAIDPVFDVPEITDEGGNKNYPFYWTSTTHIDGPRPDKAVYICFGEALGFMEQPPNSGNYRLLDVHGAGAQRSDPKDGNPEDFPNGHGPQGDVIRIFNYVRCVRDIKPSSVDEQSELIRDIELYPNPAENYVNIRFHSDKIANRMILITDISGREILQAIPYTVSAGENHLRIDVSTLQRGVYIIKTGSNSLRFVK
jgi:hypothetical protein